MDLVLLRFKNVILTGEAKNEKKLTKDSRKKKNYIFAPSLAKRHKRTDLWCNWQHV